MYCFEGRCIHKSIEEINRFRREHAGISQQEVILKKNYASFWTEIPDARTFALAGCDDSSPETRGQSSLVGMEQLVKLWVKLYRWCQRSSGNQWAPTLLTATLYVIENSTFQYRRRACIVPNDASYSNSYCRGFKSETKICDFKCRGMRLIDGFASGACRCVSKEIKYKNSQKLCVRP